MSSKISKKSSKNQLFLILYVILYDCPNDFSKISGPIAHNVPAVYDVLAARIRACVARPGPTKCGGGLPWE
jgi:hypothetical protein